LIILPYDIKFKVDTSFFPTLVIWVGQTAISFNCQQVTQEDLFICSYETLLLKSFHKNVVKVPSREGTLYMYTWQTI